MYRLPSGPAANPRHGVHALLVAGVSVSHPVIKKNFEYLHRGVPGKQPTYTLACYIFALDAAISQITRG